MPFALCPQCDAVFIVGVADEETGFGQCPYCSTRLDGLDRDEAKRRLREPLPEIRRQRPGSSHPHRKPESTSHPAHPG